MAEVVFDPELMRNIKIIYGDANLDGRTLKLIHATWLTNPDIIRSTARLKMGNLSAPISFSVSKTAAPTPTLKPQLQEIADDDLRGVKSFGAAFREARKRGLKLFKWGKGVYGTLLAANGVKNTASKKK